MKSMRFCATLILSAATIVGVCQATDNPAPQTSAPPPATPGAPASGAMILFDNTMFDFGKIASGEKVHHTYVLTNMGTETLEITNVHPGCHCTTAGDWTHKVEPGKTGQIPVQFDSTSFNGNITRTIDVYSNAKNEPHKVLMLKGLIWKPLEYASTAYLTIPSDSTNDVSTSVKIVNQTDNPVTFSNVVSVNHLFDGVLKEIKPGKEYELDITAHPPFPNGNTPGNFTVNTSLAGTPTINITAMARVTPAVQVSPSQIVLNSLPDRGSTNRVTVLSTTFTNLVLSNAKASDSQMQVELKELRKGMYNVVLVTPAGFHLEAGQRAEITIESNHPHFPQIKIPVMQFPKPKPFAAARPNPPPATAHP
jgi:hypothetical protein